MAADPDTVLLETVRTHRARLHAALVHGELAERRTVNDNLRRLAGSTVLAAVACAGCVGYAVVADLLAHPGTASSSPSSVPPAATPGTTASPDQGGTARR